MATSVLPDLPTTEDHLDFEASAATLAGIIGDRNTATPITVGVFGTWGTGKTGLMRMIEAALIKQSRRRRLWNLGGGVWGEGVPPPQRESARLS